MRLHVVFRYSGIVLILNAGFLLVSSAVSALEADTALFPLLYSAVVCALFGVFPLFFVPPTSDISGKEGLVIVVASWLLSCLVGLLPYVLWGGEFTFTKAWFESVSGFTTTGSTILSDIEALPLGLLFWRSTTHWIGGIGIIVFTLAVLPSSGRAGMILYRMEMSSVAVESFNYRTRKVLKILLFVYVGLTLLQTLSLLICGMGLFDAVTTAFATVATGGFSPRNLSVAHYGSLSIEVVIMVFMVLSGLHFGLLFAAVAERSGDLLRSPVARYYLLALMAGTLLITINVHGSVYATWSESLRRASFQVLSLGTSTGFATADSSVWPGFAQLLMIFFTLQCACAGSTSGGIKADRLVIFWKSVKRYLKKIQHPKAVVPVRMGGEVVGENLLEASLVYLSLYLGVVFVSSMILAFMDVDALTAFSGSAAAMGNVGPGFGKVGSMANFASLPDAGLWTLSVVMLLGRLEIFGLVLFVFMGRWK
ncbi:MAG: TrkH family potassium uptake protein [Deltaproteobacteria bacterium]|nr:TrkH family potassium uptake protein [Deltaproteobacteria bacterium]